MPYHKQNTLTLSNRAKLEIRKYISTMNLEENHKLPREERLDRGQPHHHPPGVKRPGCRRHCVPQAGEGDICK